MDQHTAALTETAPPMPAYTAAMTARLALEHVQHHPGLPAADLEWQGDPVAQSLALHTRRDLCRQMARCWPALDGDRTPATLALVQQRIWSARWQSRLMQASRRLQTVAEQTSTQAEQLRQLLGLPPLQLDRRERVALAALTRTLPQARSRDWAFTLRADSAAICQHLREALARLQRLQQIESQLGPCWNDELLHHLEQAIELLLRIDMLRAQLPEAWPSELYSAMVHGVGLLSTHVETTAQLSARYTPDVSQLDLERLLLRWEVAGRKLWPVSWMGRRRVLALLRRAVQGTPPRRATDVAADLRRLLRLRQLADELAQLQPLSSHVQPPLPDLQQPLADARAAVAVQTALRQARAGQDWPLAPLQSLAPDSPHGDTARQLCELHALQTELRQHFAALQPHVAPAGDSTALPHLRALLAYQQALRDALAGRRWQNPALLAVLSSTGSHAATDLQRLAERDELLAALQQPDLAKQTDGLWRGRDSDIGDIEQALRFHGSLQAAITALAPQADMAATIRHALRQVLQPGSMLLSPDGALSTGGRGYLHQLSQLQTALDAWIAPLHLPRHLHDELATANLDTLMTHAHELQQAEPLLPDWCRWNLLREKAAAIGLQPLLELLLQGRLEAGQLEPALELDYCLWWLRTQTDDRSELDDLFDSTEFDAGLHALAPLERSPHLSRHRHEHTGIHR